MVRTSSFLGTLAALLASFDQHVSAHMEMNQPLPPRSQYDPTNPVEIIDYNLKSPLNADGSNFPCHGYQNDRPIVTKATYQAGSQYTMTIAGTVNHGGGSRLNSVFYALICLYPFAGCQLSLSYDNGATFKVFQSMIGNCPLVTSWDFTIPTYAPAGEALFAWTWFNEIGDREMYMNCAWVDIQASSSSRIKKRDTQYTSMDSLPNIWRANIAGLSSCNTTEGIDPHFGDLGPTVIYGPGKSASDPVTEPNANCDSSTPIGQTYQNLGDTGAAPAVSAAPAAVSSSAGVFAEGPNTMVSTIIGALTPMGASTVPAITILTDFQTASTPTPTPTPSTSTTLLTVTTSQQPSSSASAIPFATEATLSDYLPCVPGSFLCLSSTTYMICDQSTNGIPFQPVDQFVGAPQQVSAGMQCVPFLAPLPNVPQAAAMQNATQAPAVPAGYFRSDRYVIAG
jgi:hypothetical protein